MCVSLSFKLARSRKGKLLFWQYIATQETIFPKFFTISLNEEKDKWWESVFFFHEPKGKGKYTTRENSAKNYTGNPQTDDSQCREQRGYWAAEAK